MKTTKNRYIREKNVPKEEPIYLDKIKKFDIYWPYGLIALLMAFVKVYIIAIPALVLFLILMLFVKDQVLCGIHKRFIIDYKPEIRDKDKDKVLIVYYSDIINWDIVHGKLKILTVDEANYSIDISNTKKVSEALTGVIGNKRV